MHQQVYALASSNTSFESSRACRFYFLSYLCGKTAGDFQDPPARLDCHVHTRGPGDLKAEVERWTLSSPWTLADYSLKREACSKVDVCMSIHPGSQYTSIHNTCRARIVCSKLDADFETLGMHLEDIGLYSDEYFAGLLLTPGIPTLRHLVSANLSLELIDGDASSIHFGLDNTRPDSIDWTIKVTSVSKAISILVSSYVYTNADLDWFYSGNNYPLVQFVSRLTSVIQISV
jgi:hypothetical protein